MSYDHIVGALIGIYAYSACLALIWFLVVRPKLYTGRELRVYVSGYVCGSLQSERELLAASVKAAQNAEAQPAARAVEQPGEDEEDAVMENAGLPRA